MIKTEYLQCPVDPGLLSCAGLPAVPPAPVTEVPGQIFMKSLELAWQDCSTRLAEVAAQLARCESAHAP